VHLPFPQNFQWCLFFADNLPHKEEGIANATWRMLKINLLLSLVLLNIGCRVKSHRRAAVATKVSVGSSDGF
jgi:hypothetical protein